MSFESITEIWTYCTQRYVVWEHYRNLNLLHSTRCRLRALQKSVFHSTIYVCITEIWTYCTQRDVVWEHYRNLNVFHSTIWRLRALQKSELIALNEMSFESITEIWTYCTQRDVVPEHYRNLNLLHQRNVVWEHYRNLNLLHSTRCRLRALQKSELIALNEMSFESITVFHSTISETYCTQRDVVREHYRNLKLLHSTRCRSRALQKS